MTEAEMLTKRRKLLLNQLALAADEISKIDEQLTFLLEGKKPGAGATL